MLSNIKITVSIVLTLFLLSFPFRTVRFVAFSFCSVILNVLFFVLFHASLPILMMMASVMARVVEAVVRLGTLLF